jgi:hypothetical protein
LRFQLESQKLKVKAQEDLVRHSKENFFQSQVLDFNEKVPDWSLENIQNLSIFAEKKVNNKEVQTIPSTFKDSSSQTSSETPSSPNPDPCPCESLLLPRVESCINSKNLEISRCKSLITSLQIQNKDLSSLLKSLNT